METVNVRMSGAWSEKRIRDILAKTGGHCAYCGVVLQPVSARTRASLSVDHIECRSRGGRGTLTNLAPACRGCNYSKRSLSLDEWRHRLIRRKYGEFTDNHIAHLKSLGLGLPEGFPCYPPYVFWFEEQGINLA